MSSAHKLGVFVGNPGVRKWGFEPGGLPHCGISPAGWAEPGSLELRLMHTYTYTYIY